MTSVLLLSDIHATSRNPVGRKDEILEVFENKFTFILKYAKRHQLLILQAGDFFNESRNWHVLHLMSCLLKKYKVPIYTIYGQHDLYMRADPYTTPTTLGVLSRSGLITLLSNKIPMIINNNVCIYGCSWKEAIPKPKPNWKINILVIHAPITTKELFPKHDFTGISYFVSKNKGWDLILVGDTHAQTIYNGKDTTVINTGPILRLESNKYNLGHAPSFFVYNSKSGRSERVIIPHQSSKLVMTRRHIKRKEKVNSLSVDILRKFTKLIQKQDYKIMPVKDVLQKLMKKRSASVDVKNFLVEVMEDEP